MKPSRSPLFQATTCSSRTLRMARLASSGDEASFSNDAAVALTASGKPRIIIQTPLRLAVPFNLLSVCSMAHLQRKQESRHEGGSPVRILSWIVILLLGRHRVRIAGGHLGR